MKRSEPRTSVYHVPVPKEYAPVIKRLRHLLGAWDRQHGAFLVWHTARMDVTVDIERGKIWTRLRVDGAERQYVSGPDEAHRVVMATGGAR